MVDEGVYNFFSYCNNNPTNCFDSDGYDAIMLYQWGLGGFASSSSSSSTQASGGPIFGDLALFVQNKEGDWHFFL